MNHEEAIESLAAERYILDDLDPVERDAFEEHFFDCTQCTADVRDTAKVADGVRMGIGVVPVRHYTRWAAAAAGAAVAIGLAYQYVPQVAGLRHPSSNPPSQVARAIPHEKVIELDMTRAAKTPSVIVGTQSVSIDFAIQSADPRPPYVCELSDSAGHVVASKTVTTREEASNPVTLVIPAGKIHSGNYTLGIRGDREIPPYHFAVEVQ